MRGSPLSTKSSPHPHPPFPLNIDGGTAADKFMLVLYPTGVHYPSLTSLVSSKVEAAKKAVMLTTVFAAGQAG